MSFTEDNGALLPSLSPLIPEDVEETQERQQIELTSQDRALASLLNDPGYNVIANKLKEHIDNFTTGQAMSFDKDTPLDVIGQKYVVASTVAVICRELQDLVTDAATAVVQQEQAKHEDIRTT